MKREILAIFLLLFLLANPSLAAVFNATIIPSIINATETTPLTFVFFNLNDTQNITQLSISLPNGIKYNSSDITISPLDGKICTLISLNLLNCSGSPFIANNSNTNVSFSVYTDVVSPPDYTFNFRAV
ncbi:MAG: hypothetical protein ACP5H3_02290, partial [Candidatus Aenigmatarchaeota archaeon]